MAACLLSTTCKKPERIVSFSTVSVNDTNIKYTSARLEWEIKDLGSKTIKSHGIAIAEDHSMINVTAHSSNETPGKGVYNVLINDLKKNSTYFYVAFVSVGNNPEFGTDVKSFKTKDTQVATVGSLVMADTTQNTARASANVTSDGGETVTKRGLCWGASPNPTLASCLDTTVNGSGTGAFAGQIHALVSGTQYYVRAYTINLKGTSYNSSDITFTTYNIPTLSTTALSAQTSTGATSGGNITNAGGATILSRGVCWGTSSVPTIALTTKTADGSGTGTFVSAITGLTPGAQYYIRAYATNRFGTNYGNEILYIPPVPATAVTTAATLVGNTTVTLNGTVNANNFSTTVTFEYGTTTAYGASASATPGTVTGNTATGVLANVSGLLPGTLYHYKVKAVNSGGTTDGADLTFTTNKAPDATTDAPTNITSTSATLNGTVNANNSSTAVSFEYGPTTAYGSTITATPSPLTGNTPTLVSASVTGLTPGATYHFRVKAVSTGGTTYGSDRAIGTQSPPSATTNGATAVTNSSASLNGAVNANNLSTDVRFEYGTTTGYGTLVPALPSPVTGSTDASVSASLASLTPATTYHFRVSATSSAGTTNGSDLTFTTLQPPTAVTGAATLVGNTTVTLNGNVTANNSSTTVTFEYGTTTAYGTSVTAAESPVTGSTSTGVTVNLTGLTPGTLYHYKVKGVSAGGTNDGADLTFTTTQPPTVITGSATAVSTTTATLNGTVNANNLSSAVTFEYGTTISYGSTAAATPSPVTGTSVTSVNAAMTGLTPSTTYHFRVKAVSTGGTSYGLDGSFSTPAVPVTISDFDGNVYNVVTIGTQDWMQSNLKTTHYNNGEVIPNITDNTAWSNLTTGAYSWFNNDAATYKNSFGGLYNWYIAIDVRNVCPAGWHVQTETDKNFLGVDGGSLKETGTLHWNSPNSGATNTSGFTAIPNVGRGPDGSFGGTIGNEGLWWLSTDFSISNGLMYSLVWNGSSIYPGNFNKKAGFGIRCVKGALPLAETTTATSAASTSATLNAKVNANGVTANTSFEYGTTTAYGLTAAGTDVMGSVPATLGADITGLVPGTTYHYRVKAVNSGGTTYGSDLTFNTLSPPTTTTGAASLVASTTATLAGTVNANSLSTTVSFEYGLTTSYGSTASATPSLVTGTSATSVSANLTGLTPSTTYHFRVKAVSTGGTSYGSDGSFTTSAAPTTVTDYDGNIYNVVTIGTQDWMQSNLKTTKYNDGASIPYSYYADYWIWRDLTSPAYTIYNSVYGAFYNWYATSSTSNVCPTGWHVPTNDEWTILTDYLGGVDIAGGKLKEAGFDHWASPNTDATNESGFTALCAGLKIGNGSLYGLIAGWWSSTEDYSEITIDRIWFRSVVNNSGIAGVGKYNKSAGFSIRCLNGPLPLAATDTAKTVTSTSVSLNGSVNPNGASTTVTFEYGLTTSYGSTITATQSPASGSVPVNISTNLTGLTPGTTYHYRIKALNSGGTSYGADMSFTTPATVSDVDGNIYNAVQIGTQVWMKENLKTTKFNDNTPIVLTTVNASWSSLTTASYCWYNNDLGTYKSTYGAMYNWFSVNAGNLCPTGWHVPTVNEWDILFTYLGTLATAGSKLKSTLLWAAPNPGADNSSGFTAFPGGARYGETGIFDSDLSYGHWWSSTNGGTLTANYFSLNSNASDINWYNNIKKHGLSVRCLKD